MKKITLIGTLGKDAEIKTFSGRDALSFSIAVNSGKGDNKVTEWFSILSSQTNLQPYLNKGTKIYVEGSFKLSVYNDQAQCSISATQIQLLGGGQQQATQVASTNTQTPVNDVDLPF
jgi:single stranded DNA-binding protein